MRGMCGIREDREDGGGRVKRQEENAFM